MKIVSDPLPGLCVRLLATRPLPVPAEPRMNATVRKIVEKHAASLPASQREKLLRAIIEALEEWGEERFEVGTRSAGAD